LQYKLDFYDDLLAILDDQVESGNNVIVAGDWNTAHQPIDLANPKANEKYSGFLPVERAQLDEYVEHGYVDSFRLFHDEPNRYSWWTYRYGARERNIGWRIDYFFTNQEFANQIANADIHENVMGSDHCPISLELSDNF
jgi:exodeoxyribonuclease-3